MIMLHIIIIFKNGLTEIKLYVKLDVVFITLESFLQTIYIPSNY